MGRDKETWRQGDKEMLSRADSPCLLVSPSPCLAFDRHTFSKGLWLAVGTVVATMLAGCGKVDPPPFRLNMTNVVAKQIAPENQQAIANILVAMFGTPDEPFALPETGLDQRKLAMAAGPVWSDAVGGKHG